MISTQLASRTHQQPTPHLFLDRDGTLIKEEHYLSEPSKVVLENGVIPALRIFQSAGYRLVIISNQSGIARSLISPCQLEAVNIRISELLLAESINISSWHYCPHLPNHGCSCRKPATGLFLAAHALHPVIWEKSIMVGDKVSDVQAGLAMHLFTALVTTGYGKNYVDWAAQRSVPVINSLLDLANLVIPRHDC